MSEANSTSAAPLKRSNLNLIFSVALIAQVACWTLATPGPFLRTGEHSIRAACQSAIVAFACLFVFPLAVALFARIRPATMGLKTGNWKLGGVIVLAAIPISVLAISLSGDDPEILSAYPWPGKWLSHSIINMATWFAIYSLYYVAFEFFYRGFLLGTLEPKLGLVAAMWIQVLMSVSIHFGKPTPELLASIPAGFIFGFIAWKTESIWYAFGVHWIIGILNDIYAMKGHGWL
jgi:membrane protease YdiL (CAAX protease family)